MRTYSCYKWSTCRTVTYFTMLSLGSDLAVLLVKSPVSVIYVQCRVIRHFLRLSHAGIMQFLRMLKELPSSPIHINKYACFVMWSFTFQVLLLCFITEYPVSLPPRISLANHNFITFVLISSQLLPGTNLHTIFVRSLQSNYLTSDHSKHCLPRPVLPAYCISDKGLIK